MFSEVGVRVSQSSLPGPHLNCPRTIPLYPPGSLIAIKLDFYIHELFYVIAVVSVQIWI
jgi:hypothetical protein